MGTKDKLRDHSRKPKNTVELPEPDGIGLAANPVYGDTMELRIKVKDDVIIDASFKAFGCTEAVAACSWITEIIRNKTIDQAMEISAKDISVELGLPPERMHCSILTEQVLKKTIDDFWTREGSSERRVSSLG